MARKLRNGILILLAAAVLAFALWMLWPRFLTGTLGPEGREISASIVTTGWEEVRDEGNFYNRPTMDMERYTLRRAANRPWRCWPCWTATPGTPAGTP